MSAVCRLVGRARKSLYVMPMTKLDDLSIYNILIQYTTPIESTTLAARTSTYATRLNTSELNAYTQFRKPNGFQFVRTILYKLTFAVNHRHLTTHSLRIYSLYSQRSQWTVFNILQILFTFRTRINAVKYMASKVYELFKVMHDGVKFGEIIKFYFGSIRILHCIIKIIIQRRRFFRERRSSMWIERIWAYCEFICGNYSHLVHFFNAKNGGK